MNSLGVPIVAIDLPTGVSADTAALDGPAIEASMTVTLAAPKIPLVLPPADSHAGDLVIADIGIPLPLLDELEGQHLELLTRERMREIVPARAADSHKGDFGRVLIVAGSTGRTGAAHLAALGALRSGAGLVTVATPRSCLPIIASMAPEYMTEGARRDRGGHRRLRGARPRARHDGRRHRRRPGPRPVARHRGVRPRRCSSASGVPLVLDADALNAFAGDPDRLMGRDERRRRHHAAPG